MENDDEYKEDLGYGDSCNLNYDKEMEKKKFFVPHGNETVGIGRSLFFVSEPTVVHFGGFKTQKEHSQTISVINSSSHSQRMSILPPTTPEFKILFSKCGILAPGMSQKITIIFTPNEYKYHYDCIRIHTEGQDLLIPIHGYPLINKVNFPTQISFGNTPLCESVEKVVTLQCSIPVNFFYSIDVIQPHPYFIIKPLKGVVPANGSVNIHITFNPITLGTCTSVVRLFIAEHNFTPIETVINARAVSGIIEKNVLEQAEERISHLLLKKSQEVTQKFGDTTFKQPLSFYQPDNTNYTEISPRTSKLKNTINNTNTNNTNNNMNMNNTKTIQKSLDPVGVVLKKTFGENNIESTLKNSLLKPTNGTLLLSSKVPTTIESGSLHGINKIVGNLASTQPVEPRGIGSGNVFDAGAEYITQLNQTIYESNRIKTNKNKNEESEIIVDGLRIPNKLDTIASVNFVLTQEPGKLKPKDLKVAIEKNREERKRQELEQTKIRQEGGGQIGGGLDLRAILVDEKLNSEPGDAFKRQLREMAFLADVDETKRQEIEKSFRVSEEFIGANILTPEELKIVDNQRQTYHHHRSRVEWRKYQSRMFTSYHIPQSDEVRAGAPPPSTHFYNSNNSSNNSSNIILQSNPPSFDANKNDIWSKRMNTLRKFIYLVGKWILQRRVEKRIKLIKNRLKEAGVVDSISARKFVEIENSTPFNPSTNINLKASNLISNDIIQSSQSQSQLSSLVCLLPNQALERSLHAEIILKETFQPTIEMFRRVLFPKHIVDEVSIRKPLPSVSIDEPLTFDDRTFFSLKNRMEYIDLGYERENVPLSPIYFKPISKLNLQKWQGGSEEKSLRPSAGSLLSKSDFEVLINNGCDQIFNNTIFTLPDLEPKKKLKTKKEKVISFELPSNNNDNNNNNNIELEKIEIPFRIESEILTNSVDPIWFNETEYKDSSLLYSEPSSDRDLCKNHFNYRTYQPSVVSKEIDPDWILRPTLEKFEYDVNPTLRERFLSTPGFLSTQIYLLGSNISRSDDLPLPPPGPTITDFYLPDSDLHGSGLCCQPYDYQRSLKQDDPDISSLQNKLAKEDYLTDSESDDDEDYKYPKPSLSMVKNILRPSPQQNIEPIIQDIPSKGTNNTTAGGGGNKKGNNAASKSSPTPITVNPTPTLPLNSVDTPKSVDIDAFSVLDEADRKVDQVELLRDRKTLDHAIHIQKIREEKLTILTNRLQNISKASPCPLQSLSVQLPMKDYSDELFTILQNQVDSLSNIFTDAGGSVLGSPSKINLN